MAVVRVKRNTALWRDKLRSYKVVVDGAVIGKIRDGESADFNVNAGAHQVRIKIDWSGSRALSFDVQSNQVVFFECQPNGPAMKAVFDVVSSLRKRGRPWVDLRQISDDGGQ